MTRGSWLIYHPDRDGTRIGNLTVYHNSFSQNQDPYVWSRRFLHTACSMPRLLGFRFDNGYDLAKTSNQNVRLRAVSVEPDDELDGISRP
jgi:hypothetical protein